MFTKLDYTYEYHNKTLIVNMSGQRSHLVPSSVTVSWEMFVNLIFANFCEFHDSRFKVLTHKMLK